MLYREIIAVRFQIHTKDTNTLWGQNVELLNVKLVVHIVTTGRVYCLICYIHSRKPKVLMALPWDPLTPKRHRQPRTNAQCFHDHANCDIRPQ